MERMDREPCPWRIVEDAGGAYVFGINTISLINLFTCFGPHLVQRAVE